jgi:mRNA-degrading endonuclease RelE of RelBE toxin-antitoxin system
MAVARVRLTPEAAEQVNSLPQPIRRRLLDIYERLAKWPGVSGAKPLRGDLVENYRVRTGDYRIVFTVKGDDVIIWKIGNRGGIYD